MPNRKNIYFHFILQIIIPTTSHRVDVTFRNTLYNFHMSHNVTCGKGLNQYRLDGLSMQHLRRNKHVYTVPVGNRLTLR